MKKSIVKSLATRLWLLLALIGMSAASVYADVVIEARTGGQNTTWYSETAGSWANTTATMSAAPATGGGIGSRYVTAAPATIVLSPQGLTVGGVYAFSNALPATASSASRNIVMAITASGCTGLPATTTAFQYSTALNTWRHVGTFTATVSNPTITFSRSTGSASRIFASAFLMKEMGDPRGQVAQVSEFSGPLKAGQTTATVTGCAANASAVYVFADGVKIGTNSAPAGASSVAVPVSALVKGQRLQASQVVGGVEGYPLGPTTGPLVGSGNAGIRVCLEFTVGSQQYVWLGANNRAYAAFGAPPSGSPLVPTSSAWQTVTFTPGVTPSWVWFNATSYTFPTNGTAYLNYIWFASDDSTESGPYQIYVDNVKNGDTIIEDFEGDTLGNSSFIRQPSFATTGTTPLTIPPNSTSCTDENTDVGTRCQVMDFQWKGVGPNSVRGVLYNSPAIDCSKPITLRVLVLPQGQTAPALSISQPADRLVTLTSNAVLSITATTNIGGGTLSYQWKKAGVAIEGATASTYEIASASFTDSGDYTCAVSLDAPAASTECNPFTVTVTDPGITAQPVGGTYAAGSTVNINVEAWGNGTLTYQWRKGTTALTDDTKFSGTTTPNLTITGIAGADAGNYNCVVTGVGSVTSGNAVIRVSPAIVTSPASQDMPVDIGGSLTVAADGQGTLVYQWYLNGMLIPTATTSALALTGTTDDVGSYYAVVTNSYSQDYTLAATSAVAVVHITPNVTGITADPAAHVGAGTNITLTATVTAGEGGSYTGAWSGPNGFSSTDNPVIVTPETGTYTYTATGAGSHSRNIAVTVDVAPTISDPVLTGTSPMDAGQTAIFTVTSTGGGTYQWSKGGVALVDGAYENGAVVAGATTEALTLTGVLAADAGNYTCAIQNLTGSATSNPAALVVNDPVITAQPQSQTVNAMSEVTFSVTAVGTTNLVYQWKKNSADILDATNATFSIATPLDADEGAYTVAVTNALGAGLVSEAATLTVNDPVVTAYSPSLTNAAGTTATFTIAAAGTGPLSYSWVFNGTPLASGTDSVLTIENVSDANAGTYFCTVLNADLNEASSTPVTLTVIDPPVFQSITPDSPVALGGSISLVASASGSAADVVWTRDGTPIGSGTVIATNSGVSGQTTSTLDLTNVQDVDAGSYVATFSNIAGTVASTPAVITVVHAPVVATQPVATTITRAESGSLSATFTGSDASFSWQKDVSGTWTEVATGGPISAGTPAVLNISNAQESDAGDYRVVFSNIAGSDTSASAHLHIAVDVTIAVNPVSQSVQSGTDAVFTVVAQGAGTLAYEWRKGGVAIQPDAGISGLGTASLTLSAVTSANDGVYSVWVNSDVDPTGEVSTDATLLVYTLPTIDVAPVGVTVNAGEPASFSVTASGSGTLSYQWSKNAVAITGETGTTFSIASAQLADAASYTVTVTSEYGTNTSDAAVLVVRQAPMITVQPVNRTRALGGTANFTVTATGYPALTYQWKHNDIDIAGATASAYSVSPVTEADLGYYRCTVANEITSVDTVQVTLALNNDITTTIFSDTFETGDITNNWGVVTGGTALSLSSARSHAGNLSAYMNVSSAKMYHNVGEMTGVGARFTWWIYDGGTGSATRAFGEARGHTGAGYTPGVNDATQTFAVGKYSSVTMSGDTFDATKYQGRVLYGTNTGWFNLNASGVPTRSVGFHKFDVVVSADGGTAKFYVDDILGRTIYGATPAALDSVMMGFGAGTTAGEAYFDDIVVQSIRENSDSAPVITTQPASQSVNVGNEATFSVASANNDIVSYQWKYNGVAITDATASSYTIANAQPASAGTYSVIVIGMGGTTTSADATLSIIDPAINTQPADVTVYVGQPASLSVAASGSAALTYQWYNQGGAITGATDATFAIQAAALEDAGAYYVVVDEAGIGSITSTNAVLTVLPAPSITLQPLTQSAFVGNAVTLSAAADNAVSVQWFKGTEAILDATNASLTFAAVTLADAGDYKAAFSNPAGTVETDVATLTVTKQDQTIDFGALSNQEQGSPAFTISATASSGLAVSFSIVSGPATIDGNTITLTGDLGTVIVEATQGGNEFWNAAAPVQQQFQVTAPIVRVVSPTSMALYEKQYVGTNITMSVVVTPTDGVSYQWLKDGVAIAGATDSSYTFSAALATNIVGTKAIIASNFQFAVTAANSSSSVTTNIAVVNVAKEDGKAPAVKIVSPTANLRTASVVLSGTAVEDQNITGLYFWYTNVNLGVTTITASNNLVDMGGTLTKGLGPNWTWSLPVTPMPGSNTVVVVAVNQTGKSSVPVFMKFFYKVPVEVPVNVIGDLTGTGSNMVSIVSSVKDLTCLMGGWFGNFPTTNLTMFEGQTYVLKVVPDKAAWFTNTTITADSYTLQTNVLAFMFQARSNMAINIDIRTNRFAYGFNGLWNGLFQVGTEPNEVTLANAGAISGLKIDRIKGAYSGKITLKGWTSAIKGAFDRSGHSTLRLGWINTKMYPPVSNYVADLEITLPFENPLTNEFVGTLSHATEGWTANLRMVRQATNDMTGTNMTIAIPGAVDHTQAPGGYGYAKLVYGKVGTIAFGGLLGDCSKLGIKATQSPDGVIPVFGALYLTPFEMAPGVFGKAGQGLIYGWMNKASGSATLTWIKNAATWTNYPAGFTVTPTAEYANYVAPGIGGNPFTTTPTLLEVSGGDLLSGLTFNVAITNSSAGIANAALTKTEGSPTNIFTGKIDQLKGLVVGTVGNGNGKAVKAYNTGILQSQNAAYGLFVGTNQYTGSVILH